MQGRNNAGFWLACQLRDAGVDEREARLIIEEFTRRVPQTNTKGQKEIYSEWEAFASLKAPTGVLHPEMHIHLLIPPSTQAVHIPEADLDSFWIAIEKMNGEMLCYSHTCLSISASMTTWRKHGISGMDIPGNAMRSDGYANWFQPAGKCLFKGAADMNARLSEPNSEDSLYLDDEAEQEQDEKRVLKKLTKGVTGRAFALRGLSRNTHVLAFASTDERLALTSDRWDTDPWLLGTSEGVLDLRT